MAGGVLNLQRVSMIHKQLAALQKTVSLARRTYLLARKNKISTDVLDSDHSYLGGLPTNHGFLRKRGTI